MAFHLKLHYNARVEEQVERWYATLTTFNNLWYYLLSLLAYTNHNVELRSNYASFTTIHLFLSNSINVMVIPKSILVKPFCKSDLLFIKSIINVPSDNISGSSNLHCNWKYELIIYLSQLFNTRDIFLITI